jgi:osmotically-inducible protein OsmY
MTMMAILHTQQPHNRCLAARVKAHLLRQEQLDIRALVVEAKAGVVLLHGLVPTQHQKALAGSMAAEVRGVAGVFSELAVVPRLRAVSAGQPERELQM